MTRRLLFFASRHQLRGFVLGWGVALLSGFFFLFVPHFRKPVNARAPFATIVVNTTADDAINNGNCTLREAITAANNHTAVDACPAGVAGLDTIQFDIGAGTPTINVTSPLPTIIEPVIINGNTGGATRVELNGTGVNGSGLLVQTGGSTIKNMVINRFGLAGIVLTTGNGNIVQGCYIGTDVTGMLDRGNATNGIFISSANNLVGGTTAAERNVISGNDQAGVSIGFGAGANNVVQGNLIGLAANGSAPLGNTTHGVSIDIGGNANIIGGTTLAAANFISSNGQHGVFINGNSSNNNIVQGNFIGTDVEGAALGNGGSGVHLAGSTASNTIGGTATGTGNRIAFNAVGVNLPNAGTSNRLLGNLIFSNIGLGIDLGGNGVTANDAGDGDGGPNNLQNFPVLSSVIAAGNNTVVQGSLNSTANTNFRLEFFNSSFCNQSGNGEGRTFLGFTNVTTNSVGNVTFNATLPNAVSPGSVVTATATDAGNNTSEFSACFLVVCEYAITPTAASFTPSGGSGSVNVVATSGCAWTAVSNAPWIAVTGGGSGSGNGTVNYTVAANAGTAPRSGTITIASNTFIVSQAATGVLVYTDFTGGIPLDWTIEHFGDGSYPDGTPATWTAGNPCNRVIPPPFSGTFAIVDATCAGPNTTLDERLIPPAFNASGLGTVYLEFFNRYLGVGAPNNIGDVDVSTDGGATWPGNVVKFQNVDVGSPTPITSSFNLTPFIGANPANVRVRHRYTGIGIQPSFRLLRPDAQEISWSLDFAIYYYTLSPTSQNFSGNGGTGNVAVSTSPIVPSPQGAWTATSNAPWIIPAVQGGTGNGSLGYMVSANPTPNPRTGTMTIAGNTFTVTQDACALTGISPATVPNGVVGAAYSQALTASGGTGPYVFSLSAGTLPGGVMLSTAGVLSGTPTTSGIFTFTIKAVDTKGCISTQTYTLTITSSGLQFYPLAAPVRLLDTRTGFSGCTTGTGAITANATRTQPARTTCSTIPANAIAVIGNITVVPSAPGFLTLFPSDAAQPTVANSNFKAGEVTNNFFTVGLGAADGAFKIFTSATTDVIIDLTGYYAPPGTGGLFYHPLPSPVRLVETRAGLSGCFQPPKLQGTNNPNADPSLDLQVPGRGPGLPNACSAIPNDAVVLVGNATTILPTAPFGSGYLTIYPSDAARPTVASSNYATNDIINGPFAVKLGADGKFKVYTFSTTDLVIDISGYYSASASDTNGAGLLFIPLPKPMRLLETRPDFPGLPLTGCYRTNAPIPGGTAGIRTQQAWGACSDQPPLAIPNTARALVGNATVINPVNAGFATFFPGNIATAPTVATTNYPFPVTFGYNRHYYVGLSSTDGTFKILTQFTSDYIVDVSGYFAP